MKYGELDNVKVGDTVGVRTGWVSTGWRIGVPVIKPVSVEKVTTREITVLGQRFLRNTGEKVGNANSYASDRLLIEGLWTPELEARANQYAAQIVEHKRRQELMTVIRATEFNNLPVDQLEAIVAILQAEKPEEN